MAPSLAVVLFQYINGMLWIILNSSYHIRNIFLNFISLLKKQQNLLSFNAKTVCKISSIKKYESNVIFWVSHASILNTSQYNSSLFYNLISELPIFGPSLFLIFQCSTTIIAKWGSNHFNYTIINSIPLATITV